jgi:transcriptional regulator with GAF, ATPase, and Fis domain
LDITAGAWHSLCSFQGVPGVHLKENDRLRQACEESHPFQGMVGKSKAMLQVYETIRMVAKTDLTVPDYR